MSLTPLQELQDVVEELLTRFGDLEAAIDEIFDLVKTREPHPEIPKPLHPSQEEKSIEELPPASQPETLISDDASRPDWCNHDDWHDCLNIARDIELAPCPGVCRGSATERATHIAILLEEAGKSIQMTELEIRKTFAALLREWPTDPVLSQCLRDLRYYVDGMLPSPLAAGGFRPSRIERVFRHLAGKRS